MGRSARKMKRELHSENVMGLRVAAQALPEQSFAGDSLRQLASIAVIFASGF